jgi:preprotein translocase subunit SecF
MTDLATASATSGAKESLWHRLYHGTTTYDFVGKRRRGFAISAVLLVITVAALLGRGLNLGIDFKGGVAWEMAAASITTDEAEKVLTDAGITDDAKIQTLTSAAGSTRIRVQVGAQTPEVQTSVRAAFAVAADVPVDDVDTTAVSSSWGRDITKKALQALAVFFVALTIYVSFRFEWRMAIAAIVAVVHDVAISVGAYALFGFEVAPATVIAFLTILGFSLYDTIVVFDKVHENSRRMAAVGKVSYDDVVNLSMNQVLMRSINTSLAAVLPVLSLLIVGAGILGARSLKDFALALFIGLLTGSYSSIFIATPILALLRRRGGKVNASGDIGALRRTLEGPGVEVKAAPTGPQTIIKPSTASHPPRPRKQRR